MTLPTIIEFDVEPDKVFKAVTSVIARKGYSLSNIDRASRLLSFVAGTRSVTGSAIVEALDSGATRLTISTAQGVGDLTAVAMISRGGAVGASIARAGRGTRIAEGIAEDVAGVLGVDISGNRRAPSAFGFLIAAVILGGIVLLFFLVRANGV